MRKRHGKKDRPSPYDCPYCEARCGTEEVWSAHLEEHRKYYRERQIDVGKERTGLVYTVRVFPLEDGSG